MISQFLLSSSLPLNANVLSFVGSSLVIADSNALISFPLLKLSFQLLSAPAPYTAILKCSHCSFPLFLLADSNRVLSLVFNHSNVIATTDVQASVSCLSFGNYPNNILYLVGLVDGVIGAYNTFLELQWKCNLSQLYQNVTKLKLTF
ncbi:hypothetical protein BC833DRAFT_658481 [Globomyces pollinis-pini]|nr:hypothetical protein BC833DRAFT_658481 [Globomyces pollinis-pini]